MNQPDFARRPNRAGLGWMLGLLLTALLWAVPSSAPAQSGEGEQVDAATKMLMGAHGLYERRLYELSAEEYAEFLKKHSDHERATDARYGLALSHYNLKQYGPAAEAMEKVLADKGFQRRADARAVLAHSYLSANKPAEAKQHFERLLKDHPDSPHADLAAISRVQALYQLEDYEPALAAAKQFRDQRGESPRLASAIYYQALSHSALKQAKPAAETLKHLLEKYANAPFTLDARLLLGQNRERLGEYEAAAEAYRRMLKQAPESRRAEARYMLGSALQRAGEHESAISEFKKLLAEDGESDRAAPARLQLGISELNVDRLKDARRTLQEVVKQDETRAVQARYYLARADMKEEKYEEARKKLADLKKAKLETPAQQRLADRIAYDLAICSLAMEDFERAIDDFRAFLNDHKDSDLADPARYRLALAQHRAERYEESLKAVEPLTGDPKHALYVRARELAAENLFLLDRYEQADEIYAALIERTEDEGKRLNYTLRRGQAAYYQDDLAAAVERLKPILEAGDLKDRPQLYSAVFLTGDAHLQQGNHDKAVDAFSRYLELADEPGAEARFKYALATLRGGDRDAAWDRLRSAMSGDVQSGWVQRALLEFGQLAYQRDKPKEASEALNKLLKAEAPDGLRAPAVYLLGWIAMDAGDHEQAAERFGRLVSEFGDHELAAEALYQQAVALRRADRMDQAAEKLTAYVNQYPEGKHVAQARYLIGVAAGEGGDHAAAIKTFRELAEDEVTRTDSVLYDLAWTYRRAEQPKEAEKVYALLLEEFPDSALAIPARVELAELRYQREAYEQIPDLLKPVLEAEEVEADLLASARYRLAWTLAKTDRQLAAAEAFEKFVEAHKEHDLVPAALYQAGVNYAAGGKNEPANQAFAKLIEHDDAKKSDLYAVGLIKRGQVLAELGDYQRSAQMYQRYLDEQGQGDYRYLAQFGIGWAHEQRKQYEDARQWYTRVTDNHNGETAARAQFQIGQTYFAEKAFKPALKELLKVDIIYNAPRWASLALFEAGRVAEQLDQADNAREYYTQVTRKYPDSNAAARAKQRLQALGG